MSTLAKLTRKENLTTLEAEQVMEDMLEEKCTPSQSAAILVALRMKGETTEELEGFVHSMRRHMVSVSPNRENLTDTCGTGGDGLQTFNVSTTAAFIAAGAGVPIAKHGNRSVSSHCGSADVLEALGAKMMPPAVVERCIERVGIGFAFAPFFHPAMKKVAGVRKELGIRTVFNLLGPLANPAGAKRQTIGVYDPGMAERMIQVLGALGSEHALIIHSEGMDEIGLGKTQVIELKNGRIETYQLDATEFGFQKKVLRQVNSATESAVIVREILAGKPSAETDVALLNAAAAIYAGGKASSLEQGVGLARTSIAQGSARQKLEQLISFGGEIYGHSG